MPTPRIERKIVACGCGCGQTFETPSKWGAHKTYVKGHHSRVQRKGIYPTHLVDHNNHKRVQHISLDGIIGKVCAKCKTWKPLAEYGSDKTAWDGKEHRCLQCLRERYRRYHKEHRKEEAEKRKDPSYKEKFREYSRVWRKRKYTTNKNYRLEVIYKVETYQTLKGKKTSKRILRLLGCSIEELKAHLERQFKPGMSWDNYGQPGWEIDHIRPCSSFDLSDPRQLAECLHYTNLQPLWGPENRAKSNRFTG